ncbi:phosphoribosylaminoimidazolesuccinocarboxamide synthase [Paenibacillus dendritiformis]|uniref:phosphoribosylaminoimidazolesuccinocarboxamide synthase n=1 Tax=Paenibacillus dendritiformis TaxID=130049 RepID=UPI00387E1302
MSTNSIVSTLADAIPFPLLHRGKVRELYEWDADTLLIVVSDRISAFDRVLEPAVPDKGTVLNRLSRYWFERTKHIIGNHVIPCDEECLRTALSARLGTEPEPHQRISSLVSLLSERMTLAKRAQRVDFECVVRGYVTGGGWRQYTATGEVNGIKLPEGLRMNERLPEPIFTPARKHDEGHDEDVSFEVMEAQLGPDLAGRLRDASLRLYRFAAEECAGKGLLLADCKFEFGLIDGELVLIDELFTPDSSRFWDVGSYALDTDIDSLDKEPVRRYLAASNWDRSSTPPPLPAEVVEATRGRYIALYERITAQRWA